MYCVKRSSPIGTKLSIKNSWLDGSLMAFLIPFLTLAASASLSAKETTAWNRLGRIASFALFTTWAKFAAAAPIKRYRSRMAAGSCTASLISSADTIRSCVFTPFRVSSFSFSSLPRSPPRLAAVYSFMPVPGFSNKNSF